MTDVILHLGGNINRIEKTIEIALKYPQAIIVVSSEGGMQEMVNLFKSAGIDRKRVIFDIEALDTPGNFCLTYKLVKSFNPKYVYVVTDKFHMERSMTLARITYFGTGITPIACPYMGGDLNRVEPKSYTIGNVLSVVGWKLTGQLYVSDYITKTRTQYKEQGQQELEKLVW